MGKASEPDGTDVEKERWWQQEREVFQGRANSFIARMRLVQGDRRFSPWKGSVVDSVVGVFLTQNVADHLSRTAGTTLSSAKTSTELPERIQNFLNRLVRDHGSIDLEWLRDIPPDSAKDYLLSIRGLGLKSVECVRLLTLHHLAFPVDTNVGRICVRLGWVPIQPLPESLQLHLLELYPVLETIQKYLWPRLCKLDQQTLYELHYQMITFGKNLENCIKESNKDLQSDDIAKALVAVSTEAASIPVPKLKNVHRLRTEHYVYELPDSHPLLQKLGLDQREPDDPTPYLLAIWTQGMHQNHVVIHKWKAAYAIVPCRTAMRGSFPLNGTYFQVNEPQPYTRRKAASMELAKAHGLLRDFSTYHIQRPNNRRNTTLLLERYEQ
nr:unnamed protein product [Digitaria exilis]